MQKTKAKTLGDKETIKRSLDLTEDQFSTLFRHYLQIQNVDPQEVARLTKI